jgi:tetratricopeptide (TPR) repeat protein
MAASVAVSVSASPLSRARTEDGFALAYDLQFDESRRVLAEAVAADPSDPAPHRAMAAIAWIEILFAQGVATFEAFTGEVPEGDVARPPAPAHLVARFSAALATAAHLAARQVELDDDADAHYQVGATTALECVYGATVEGRTIGALRCGRRAVAAMTRARARSAAIPESALLLALSEYTVATLPWAARMVARVSGLSGSRARAMALLEEAAAPGALTASDALLLRMVIYAREGRHEAVVADVRVLQARHPGNRLFWLNEGAAAAATCRWAEADAAFSRGIAGRRWASGPRIHGEGALWLWHRGAARAAMGRHAEASDDLTQALAAGPRDWVRGRIHYQFGELALVAGQTGDARREFEAAVAFSIRGGDSLMTRRARDALQSLTRH